MWIDRSTGGARGRRAAKAMVIAAITALVVVGVAAAAALRGDTRGTASASDTFVLANAVKIDTLDPAQNSVNESIWLTQNLYSRLVQPNATGTALLPDLATSWKITNGGRRTPSTCGTRSSPTARRSRRRTRPSRSCARRT